MNFVDSDPAALTRTVLVGVLAYISLPRAGLAAFGSEVRRGDGRYDLRFVPERASFVREA